MFYSDDDLFDLHGLALVEVYDAAQETWHNTSVLEDLDSPRIRQQASELIERAAERGCETVEDLLPRAAEVLRVVTGITHLTRYLPIEQAETLQQYRAALGAVLAGAAIATDADPMPLLASLPDASARHGGPTRGLHDDEILLLRLRALHLLQRGPRLVPALLHTIMGDAGARPSETTVIAARHFDNVILPSRVDLPGVSQMAAARTVPLPTWSRPLVAEVLARHVAVYQTDMPVAFRGKKPGGAAASASASRILANAFAEVGIAEPPQPSALARWRVAKTADQGGLEAAADISGHVKIDTALSFMGRNVTSAKPRQRRRRRGYASGVA